MSDATSADPTALLFGLEEEFSVLKVQRIDAITVKMIIEQTVREGPCPACGVLTSAVKERPLRRLKDLPASGQMVELWWRKRRLESRQPGRSKNGSGCCSNNENCPGSDGGWPISGGDRRAPARGHPTRHNCRNLVAGDPDCPHPRCQQRPHRRLQPDNQTDQTGRLRVQITSQLPAPYPQPHRGHPTAKISSMNGSPRSNSKSPVTVAPWTLSVQPTCTPRIGPCARSVPS